MFSSYARRRSSSELNIWPGFVDALGTLLLVFIFMITLFTVAQYFLSDALSGSQAALKRLEAELSELADTLAMERRRSEELETTLTSLSNELQVTVAERNAARADTKQAQEELNRKLAELASLRQDIETLRQVRTDLENQVGMLVAELQKRDKSLAVERDRSKALSTELAETTHLTQLEIEEKETRIAALSGELGSANEDIARLNRQVAALREQLSRISALLELSEDKVAAQSAQIEDLGQKLNLALADKVQELSRYRSEFFGRLRELLGEREDIRIVGDRFVFQSELFFETASAELGPAGKDKLAQVAQTLRTISGDIPDDIDWVLQVEGHTDRRPINTPQFPSNWELSTARAISIVNFLIDQGIPPKRLSAAGFAEHAPVDPRNTPEAYAKNRRIELKLTSR